MLRLPNIPEFTVSLFAVQKIGAVSVPIHTLWRIREISYIANDCEAKVLITTSQSIKEAEKARDKLLWKLLLIASTLKVLKSNGKFLVHFRECWRIPSFLFLNSHKSCVKQLRLC